MNSIMHAFVDPLILLAAIIAWGILIFVVVFLITVFRDRRKSKPRIQRRVVIR